MSEMLKQEFCEPCSLGTPPLEGEALNELMGEVDSEWALVDGKKISRKFKFKNFKSALDFVNVIGEIAESEGHHPDIELGWGSVVVSLTTHKIDGLSRNDFILASKIDALNE